jgi:hypothetical protein
MRGRKERRTIVLIEPSVLPDLCRRLRAPSVLISRLSSSRPQSPRLFLELTRAVRSVCGRANRIGIVEGDDEDGRFDGLERLGVRLGDGDKVVSSLRGRGPNGRRIGFEKEVLGSKVRDGDGRR